MKQRASGSRRLPASAWVFDSALALVAAGVSTLFFIGLMNDAQLALLRGLLATTPVREAAPPIPKGMGWFTRLALNEPGAIQLLAPGDEAIVVEGGKFGDRWRGICQAYGIAVHRVSDLVGGHDLEADDSERGHGERRPEPDAPQRSSKRPRLGGDTRVRRPPGVGRGPRRRRLPDLPVGPPAPQPVPGSRLLHGIAVS